MKIYLDIDGVLLKKALSVPDYGPEFINYLVSRHDCYWLTTHCRGGENKAPQYLSQFYPFSILHQLEKIKPAFWTDLKTEAIDFNEDFIWLEDNPFDSEKKVLLEAKKSTSLIVVELKRKDELKRVQEKIEMITFI